MIFTPIIYAVLGLLMYALNTLPSMSQEVIDAIYGQMNMLVPKFVALGYYYLPMAQILFFIKAYIVVWVTVFGIRLLMKIISIATLGFVGTDKL